LADLFARAKRVGRELPLFIQEMSLKSTFNAGLRNLGLLEPTAPSASFLGLLLFLVKKEDFVRAAAPGA